MITNNKNCNCNIEKHIKAIEKIWKNAQHYKITKNDKKVLA